MNEITLNFIVSVAICHGAMAQAVEQRSLTMDSDVTVIDNIYQHMAGPIKETKFSFISQEPAKTLLWITGVKAAVVDAATGQPKSPAFLCHGDFRLKKDGRNTGRHHNKVLFAGQTHQISNVGTVVQGSLDITFPSGFGVPLWSEEEIVLESMVINPLESGKGQKLKVKGTIKYVRDADLKESLKPLFRRFLHLFVKKGASEPSAQCEDGTEETLDTGAPVENAMYRHKTNSHGEPVTHHWMVPPGRHVYRYELPNGLDIPFDTTLHHASVHLHPYGKSLEVKDLTTGKTIYKSLAENSKDGLSIEKMSIYSSEKGIPVFKGHRYELISVYDNTTKDPVDAMAIVSLHFLDKEFKKDGILGKREKPE